MALEYWLGVHPGLESVIKITSNTVSMEFDACAAFGIDPYIQFQRSREWRRAIVGKHVGKQAVESMKLHDMKLKPKKGKKQ